MAGTTSWIICNLMSTIQRLSQLMHPFPLLPSSSTTFSSSTVGEVSSADVNSNQERSMEDLSRLTRMLQRIQAVLHDAEEREIYDKAIQLWLRELREVSYEAEDVLDEYDYQVIKTQVEGMITTTDAEPSLIRKQVNDDDDLYGRQVSPSSSTLINIPISCNMAIRIMKIIEKFDEIAKDREALQLKEEDGIRQSTFDDALKRPPSSSLVNDSDIFGREDDKKKIIQLLMRGSEKKNTVIPIVGLGGVGKTTLAQLVYNDHVVCEHFSPKVWVCISEEFDVVRITKEIVTSIMGHYDNNNLNDLQCMLKKALLKKRFLLILDDVWNERLDIWEALRAPFSCVGMGKIIVTTRSMSVARIMQTVPPYELGCLDEEKSWLLFKRHAFHDWGLDQQHNFEQIGMQITEKCGGLPLALKAIGGFLRYEVEEHIWKDVLNNNIWELEDTKNLILPALRISYNHLPTHLKPCFVYASLFPKDREFEKIELIRMWIAQGYIQLTGRKRLLEDIAFEYFEDLHGRSFFQYSKYDKFTLHDMMHELARSIARNEICSLLDYEELKTIPTDTKHIFIQHTKVAKVLLFGAIRTFYNVSPLHSYPFIQFPERIFSKESFSQISCLRVLSFHAPTFDCKLQIVDLIGNLQQLCYLSIHANTIQMTKWSLCSLYKLQTLKLRSVELNMLPCEIRKLINLRHLVIHCNQLRMLPKSICQLENLLTLDIEYCYQLRELPLGISKLTNLRHLILPNVKKFYIHYEIHKMKSLHTLPRYYLRRDSHYSGIGWLKHLKNLRGSLHISTLQNVVNHEDAKSANLQNKPHIERLILSWKNNRKDDECARLQAEAVLDGLQPHTNLKELTIDGYGGNNFPSWFDNPHFSNLKKIHLINLNSNEECKFLPLSRLPSLRSLEIENNNGIRRMGQDFWCYISPSYCCENNPIDVHVGFHQLEYPTNKSMPEWKVWPTVKNGDFSSLQCLRIIGCHKLELLSNLPSSLEKFEVKDCRTLEYVALDVSFGLLSRLEKVKIKYCQSLKSVNNLTNLLATLKFLKLCNCPLLQPNPHERSDHTFTGVSLENVIIRVIYCPKMINWCRRHGLTYEPFGPTKKLSYILDSTMEDWSIQKRKFFLNKAF